MHYDLIKNVLPSKHGHVLTGSEIQNIGRLKTFIPPERGGVIDLPVFYFLQSIHPTAMQ
jgi:hypothetical protein